MMTEATELRRQRGLVIAATSNIAKKGKGEWLVPSQSEVASKYRVVKGDDGFRCNCPDFELRGETCKHGFAVEFVLKRETKPDGTVIETRAARVTYSQSWSAYNQAQTTEKEQFCKLLRDLVADVPNPEQKRGRPALPLSEMLFAACFKVYSTVSARRFMTDLRTATEQGFLTKTPHYNSIFNVLDRTDVTPILQDLIVRAALPLKALETDFAVDSTGFGTQCFYRHYSAKYGKDRESRSFLKVHAMVGTKTNVVTTVSVTEGHYADSLAMDALVTETSDHFNVKTVAADKAYSSKHHLAVVESLGATPYIPFKVTATYNTSTVWNRLFHFFNLHRDEFLSHYHKRSNIEATFSAIKRKFGDTIRSKSPVAQKNEALLKVLCHNIVCVIHEVQESGATATFPALAAGCPKKVGVAQESLLFE